MNLRTRDMRRAAALVLDAVPAVLEHLDQEVLERPDHGSPWELACRALHVANEAWQAAQLAQSPWRPKKRKPLRRKPRSKAKRQATADVRAQVFERAKGRCESPICDRPATDLDHVRGRGRARESVANCLALCRTCHEARHSAVPSAAYWLEMFAAHCRKHGYSAEARWATGRLKYVETRAHFGEQLQEKLSSGGEG